MSVRVGDEIVAGGQGDMYTKAQVDALIANAIAQTTEKPGMIKPFAGTTVPTGYLLCDGSAVSRTTYADLFAAIGTTYGSGDGSTTFNLPNVATKETLISGTLGSYYWGTVPNITGGIINGWDQILGHAGSQPLGTEGTGAFRRAFRSSSSETTTWAQSNASGTTIPSKISFDARRVSDRYADDATKVYAAGIGVHFIIKY